MRTGSYQGLKEQVCQANIELFERGLVKYSFGNVSGIDRRAGVVAIKPSVIPYTQLTPDRIVILDLTGKIIEGDFHPSSDTPTHLVLCRAFPTIGGVAHTHSTYAVAWAQSGREIPCFGTTHADYSPRAIPCTLVLSDSKIMGKYEHETGVQIVQFFSSISYEETPMILVHSRSPFTWGCSPEEAVFYIDMLEEIATVAYLTCTISPEIDTLKQTLIYKHFRHKHDKEVYYGQ